MSLPVAMEPLPNQHNPRAIALYLAWLLPTAGGVGLLALGRAWPGSLLLLLPLLIRVALWVRADRRGVRDLGWSALLWPGLVLAAAVLPGLLVSVNMAVSLSRFQSLLAGLVVYAAACLLRGWERRAALVALVAGLVAFCAAGLLMADWGGAALIALPALYDHLPHLALPIAGSGVLAGRDDLNPRMVGGVCAILLMPTVGLLLLVRNWAARLLTGAALVIGLGTLALTQSPEALLGLLAGGVVFALAARRSSGLLTAAYFGLLALLAVPPLLGTLTLPASGVMLADSGNLWLRVATRLELWNRAAAMFADGPLVGVGLNNFPFVYHNAYQGFLMDDRAWAIAVSAHNGYLQAAADGGIVGLVAFVGLLVAAYAWWRRAARLAPVGAERIILAAALAGVAAFAGFNFVDSLTLGAKAGPTAWLLLGLLASSSAASRQGATAESPAAADATSTIRRPFYRTRFGGFALLALLAGAALVALFWLPLYTASVATVEVRRAVAENRALGPDRAVALPGAASPQVQQALAQAEATDPGNNALLYQQGVLSFTFADYAAAADTLQRYTAAAGVRAPAAYYLGWSLFYLGRDADAVTAWQETGSADVLLAGGDALAARSPTAAATAYRAADAAAPGHMEPLLRLGELSERAGDHNAAHAAFAQLQQRFPQIADPYIAEAQADLNSNQPAPATDVLQRALQAGAAPAWLVEYWLSQAYSAQQNMPQALYYARQAATAAPDNATVQQWKTELESRAGSG